MCGRGGIRTPGDLAATRTLQVRALGLYATLPGWCIFYPRMQILAKAAVGIWIIVLAYFAWQGVTTPAWEGDSLAYHIPIAGNIAVGKWGNIDNWLEYYPGMGEMILAGFMKLGIPLNLYNVVGWAALFWICRKLGGSLFAAAVCLLPSVVRLIPTQTVDIWLAVFGLLAVSQLSVLSSQLRGWIKFGIFLGLLIGTKYSGLGFAAVLLIAAVLKTRSKNFILAVLVAMLVGGFWYARNWAEKGHPLYPMGAPNFHTLDRREWMIPVYYPAKFAEAVFSEYLIWPVLGLLVVWRKPMLAFLAGGNFLVYLFIPAGVENVLSDLRYIYLVVIPLMLAVFMWAKDKKKEEELGVLAILMMAVVLTQLDYHPKLFVAVMTIWILGNWPRRQLLSQ